MTKTEMARASAQQQTASQVIAIETMAALHKQLETMGPNLTESQVKMMLQPILSQLQMLITEFRNCQARTEKDQVAISRQLQELLTLLKPKPNPKPKPSLLQQLKLIEREYAGYLLYYIVTGWVTVWVVGGVFWLLTAVSIMAYERFNMPTQPIQQHQQHQPQRPTHR